MALVEGETTVDFLSDGDVVLIGGPVAMRLAFQTLQVVVHVEQLVVTQLSQIKHLQPAVQSTRGMPV